MNNPIEKCAYELVKIIKQSNHRAPWKAESNINGGCTLKDADGGDVAPWIDYHLAKALEKFSYLSTCEFKMKDTSTYIDPF